MKWTGRLLALFSAGALMTSPAEANLVVNGGFEAGSFSFPGWTQAGNTDFTWVSDEPHSGRKAAWFGPVGSLGGIYQMTSTIPGATYDFDFWLKNDGSFAEGHVFWNGLEVLTLNNPGNSAYTHYVFTEEATSSATQIKFLFRNDPGWFRLDDINVERVVAVPESGGTLALLGTALLALWGTRRRR